MRVWWKMIDDFLAPIYDFLFFFFTSSHDDRIVQNENKFHVVVDKLRSRNLKLWEFRWNQFFNQLAFFVCALLFLYHCHCVSQCFREKNILFVLIYVSRIYLYIIMFETCTDYIKVLKTFVFIEKRNAWIIKGMSSILWVYVMDLGDGIESVPL